MTRDAFLRLIGTTLLQPREAGETVLALRPTREVVWTGLALVTVLGALSGVITQLGAGTVPMPDGAIVVGPMAYAAILGLSLLLTAWALNAAGRAFGGEGRFDEALALIVWLEIVALAVRLVSDLLLFIAPPISVAVGLVGLLALLWALVNFVRVLHRFPGLGKAVLTLVVAMIGLGIGLSILMGFVGVGPEV